MRPKITTSHNIARSIFYNEQKVQLGVAERLVAANFLKECPKLTTEDIIQRFQRRMELNDRVTTNLHITLNFDPQDKIPVERMVPVMHLYMKEIGFGEQPWVGWGHNDAGHPHCHIVTTHVKRDGDPIDLYKIGEDRSEKARQKIEAEFNLVTGEMKKQQRLARGLVRQEFACRVEYGREPLTRSISDVLEHVTEQFKYTSFDELNAILRHYNVEADRGQPGTRLYENGGLLYRALDENGHSIGRPLKASFFDCKPTLDKLEQRFVQNLSFKQEQKERIEAKMCMAVTFHPDDPDGVRSSLSRDGLELSVSCDMEGNCTGITVVDFGRRVVFSGEELDGGCNHLAMQRVIEGQRLREARELTLGHELRESLRQSRGMRIGF
jgi:hypothetical protein